MQPVSLVIEQNGEKSPYVANIHAISPLKKAQTKKTWERIKSLTP